MISVDTDGELQAGLTNVEDAQNVPNTTEQLRKLVSYNTGAGRGYSFGKLGYIVVARGQIPLLGLQITTATAANYKCVEQQFNAVLVGVQENI